MMRRHVRVLGPILVGALALRCVCFAGLTLGDDPGYASLARAIIDHGFPSAGGDPLAARPLFLLPIAASVSIFGWSEAAMIAPTLIASLAGIAAAYALGALVESPAVGAAAALTLAAFPLDVVHATTLTNDIPGSAMVALGAAAGWLAIAHPSSPRLAASSGFILATALGVKLSFLVPATAVALMLTAVAVRDGRVGDVGRPVLAGYAAGLATLAAFYLASSGAALAPFDAEMSFNRRHLLPYLLSHRADVLTFYPRWALLWQAADQIVGRFAPYGLLFPIFLLALTRTSWTRSWRLAFAPVWALVTLAWLEFAPLQLVPYAPIHRLPRFLAAAAIPAAIAIGSWAVDGWKSGGGRRAVSVAACGVYLAASAYAIAIMTFRQQDTMRDMRTAASVAAAYNGPIVADSELLNYLAIRQGYRHLERFRELQLPSTVVPPDALVVVGGSRRSELDPAWVDTYRPRAIAADWVVVARLSPALEPWRRSQGVVYRTGALESTVAFAGPGQ